MDQLESITDENDRARLFKKMTVLSDEVGNAERNQVALKSITKHVQTLRKDLERYYVLKII